MTHKLLLLVMFFLIQFASFSQQTTQPGRITFAAQTIATHFTWRGDSLFARWEPHAVMLVPVKITGCPRTLFMQFDLGSPYSLLYKNTIRSVESKFPGVTQISTAKDTLNHFSFAIGGSPVDATQMPLRSFGDGNINWNDTLTPVIIGTLGTDLVDGRSFLINYPQQKIEIGSNISKTAGNDFAMTDFVYMAGRILLPAIINGKNTLLFFDTGSSAFSLLTDQPTAMQLAEKNASPVTHKANSWGGQWNVFTWPSADSATLASRKLALKQVSYVESGYSNKQAEQMRRVGIGGVTGNKLFINSILWINTRDKKFGIVLQP